MFRNKSFEWLGFMIVGVSIYANAIIRENGTTTGYGINLSVAGIVGAILTFTFFSNRKFGNKEDIEKNMKSAT